MTNSTYTLFHRYAYTWAQSGHRSPVTMENKTAFANHLEASTSVEQKRKAKWRKRIGIKNFKSQPQPELRCCCPNQYANNLAPSIRRYLPNPCRAVWCQFAAPPALILRRLRSKRSEQQVLTVIDARGRTITGRVTDRRNSDWLVIMGHCTGAGPEVPGQAPTGQKVKDTKYGVQADGSGLALLGDKRGVETQPQKPESESESESASLERAPALSWQCWLPYLPVSHAGGVGTRRKSKGNGTGH